MGKIQEIDPSNITLAAASQTGIPIVRTNCSDDSFRLGFRDRQKYWSYSFDAKEFLESNLDRLGHLADSIFSLCRMRSDYSAEAGDNETDIIWRENPNVERLPFSQMSTEEIIKHLAVFAGKIAYIVDYYHKYGLESTTDDHNEVYGECLRSLCLAVPNIKTTVSSKDRPASSQPVFAKLKVLVRRAKEDQLREKTQSVFNEFNDLLMSRMS